MRKSTTKMGLVLSMLLVSFCGIRTANAQKILSGDLKFLSGVKSINVVFDFSNFKIEDETEQQYLDKEVAEKNKKEAGSGDKFLKEWEDYKKNKVIVGFVKSMKDGGLEIKTKDSTAKYTLIVHDINLTNKGFGNKFAGGTPARMEVDYDFVETANKANSPCKLRELKAQYMSMTGTLTQKIQGCLEYSGYQMGKTINKNLK